MGSSLRRGRIDGRLYLLIQSLLPKAISSKSSTSSRSVPFFKGFLPKSSLILQYFIFLLPDQFPTSQIYFYLFLFPLSWFLMNKECVQSTSVFKCVCTKSVWVWEWKNLYKIYKFDKINKCLIFEFIKQAWKELFALGYTSPKEEYYWILFIVLQKPLKRNWYILNIAFKFNILFKGPTWLNMTMVVFISYCILCFYIYMLIFYHFLYLIMFLIFSLYICLLYILCFYIALLLLYFVISIIMSVFIIRNFMLKG